MMLKRVVVKPTLILNTHLLIKFEHLQGQRY